MKRTLVLIAYLTLLACGDTSGNPEEVTRHYWAAVKKGDQAAVEQLSVSEESKLKGSVFTSETKIEGDKIREIRFGATTITEDHALVVTTVLPELDSQADSGPIGEVVFDTQLARLGGEWKVDKTVTDKNMMGAAFTAIMGAMGAAIGEGMQQAMTGMGEALSDGMKAMAEGFSQGGDTVKSEGDEVASPGEQNTYIPPVVLPARVGGSIRNTRVELSSAEWSNTLAIYSGDGWGFNPSLLIFLFLNGEEVPAARTITVKSEDKGFSNPHVHYRWRDPQSGEIKTEVATGNYDMVLKLGEPKGRRVSGEIQFSVPGDGTRLEGTFEIELKP